MSWRKELKNNITTAAQLANVLRLSPDDVEKYAAVIARFPMQVTPYYLSLVDTTSPNDPIGKMCLPSLDELQKEGSFDTSGESDNTKLAGLQHKYSQTALLLSTNQCAMYCRHCFRKRMVGYSEAELNKRADEAVEYVKMHPEINNVLVSGGDALMNPNHIIKRYLEELTAIEHLDFLRFGSRIPVTFPQRICGDKELLDLFETYAKQKRIYLVTQFNHPREITVQAAEAVERLLERGIQIRNQTVLLRDVNDDGETLGTLLSRLTAIGVSPYYIFQCRPVTGVKSRFQVPIPEAVRIVDDAKKEQNGFGKSVRFVMSHPRGKIEILGELQNGETIFKFHQSREAQDSSVIFTRKLSAADTWLDDDLNGV